MSSAREIIAQAFAANPRNPAHHPLWAGMSRWYRAAYRTSSLRAVEALEDAGFRILAPDQLDPATVERCAQVADEASKNAYRNAPAASYRSPEDEALVRKTAEKIAERIRTLTGGNNGR